jgi:MFS family permease
LLDWSERDADTRCVRTFAVALALVTAILLRARALARREADPASPKPRHIGPEAAWPWAALGLGVAAVSLAFLYTDLATEPTSGDDGGCLDVCVGPDPQAIMAALAVLVFVLAGLAAIVAGFAVTRHDARVVGAVGIALAILAAVMTALAV